MKTSALKSGHSQVNSPEGSAEWKNLVHYCVFSNQFIYFVLETYIHTVGIQWLKYATLKCSE